MKLRQVDPDKARWPKIAAIILIEWLGTIGIVVGVGAIPFTARLNPWFIDRFWVLPLAVGGLVLVCGLLLTWRQIRNTRPAQPDADVYRYLPAGAKPVPPWLISTRMRLVITGSRYKFYQQPEVNLLLDEIMLARNSSYNGPIRDLIKFKFLAVAGQAPWDFNRPELENAMNQAVTASLTLATWLEETAHTPPASLIAEQPQQPGQPPVDHPEQVIKRTVKWAGLHDELAALNRALADDDLTAADLTLLMEKRMGNAFVAQDNPDQVVLKFIDFLSHTNLKPSELPEKLACYENDGCREEALPAAPAREKPSDADGSTPTPAHIGEASPVPASAQGALPAPAPVLPSFAWMLMWGALILLPGLVALMVRAADLDYPLRITIFSGTPALLVWLFAAATGLLSAWVSTPRNWAGLVKNTLQAAGALLILVYLGLCFSRLLDPAPYQVSYLAWVDWLLAAGAGFAVANAFTGSILAFVQ